jgi:gas vesicle protein
MHQLIDMTPDMMAFEADSGLVHTQSQSGNGGSGGGDDMQGRVTKLEEQVTSLVLDVAVIKSNYATKEDISKLARMIEGTKTEFHSSIEGTKTELHRSIESVKTELYSTIESTKTELHRSIESVKTELYSSQEGMKSELYRAIDGVKLELHRSIEGVRIELYQAITGQTKWFISALFIALGAGLTIAKFLFR